MIKYIRVLSSRGNLVDTFTCLGNCPDCNMRFICYTDDSIYVEITTERLLQMIGIELLKD